MRFKTFLLAVFFIAPSLVSAATAGSDTPVQVVENLHRSLLIVMEDAESLGYQGRYDYLNPVISATFDFPFIARVVVGRYWNGFSDEEKATFVDTFSRLSIATYAGRFDGYSGERFEVVSSRATRRGYMAVGSLLIKPEGGEINLDYILHKNGDQWRVVNVIADGVSDLSLKRADYTSYLKKNGFESFINELRRKISCYAE